MFDYYFTNDEALVCPYCHQEQLCHEPDDISADMCYTECEHCEKSFWYSVNVTRHYTASKDEKDENCEAED